MAGDFGSMVMIFRIDVVSYLIIHGDANPENAAAHSHANGDDDGDDARNDDDDGDADGDNDDGNDDGNGLVPNCQPIMAVQF